VDYEDEEILWVEENRGPDIKGSGWSFPSNRLLMNANLAIRINPSQETFDVLKNRWGHAPQGVVLDLLDEFLEHPQSTYWNLAGTEETK